MARSFWRITHPSAAVSLLLIAANMARPLRLHVPGLLYHVMSRGNGKQQIFLAPPDYQHFVDILSKTTQRLRVECCGYCLMPTHYHAILRPREEPLSRMMQQLNSSYSLYFNRTHKRVGHVFQGRFKSLIVEGDDYFLTLLRYMMQNPVAAKLTKVPSAWPWSSYRTTAGLCPVPSFLSPQSVWAIFDSGDIKRAQRRFIEFVALSEGSVPLLETIFFGSTEFVEGLAPRLEPVRGEREFRYADRFADRPPLTALLAGATEDPQRTQAMREAFFRYAYTLREIAAVVGCHPTTIWRRVSDPEKRERRLVKVVKKLQA